MMFDRFTDRAKRSMSLARQSCAEMGMDNIGTEHLLIGLCRDGHGVAAAVLRDLGVVPGSLEAEVLKIVKRSDGATPPEHVLPFTSRAKRVIELAADESFNVCGDNYIGTEHLLLGLIRENEGIAAQVMLNLKLSLEDVRSGVMRYLGKDKPNPVEDDMDRWRGDAILAFSDTLADAERVQEVSSGTVRMGLHLDEARLLLAEIRRLQQPSADAFRALETIEVIEKAIASHRKGE